MNALRLRIQPIAWLALVAMLALVLTPTLAHAIGRALGGGPQWVEICTDGGMRLVAVQASDSDDAALTAAAEAAGDGARMEATGDLECCTDDLLIDHVLVPPPVHACPDLGGGAAYLAPLFLQAPYTLFAWLDPPSRAPPLNA